MTSDKKSPTGPDEVTSWGPIYGAGKESTEPYEVCANCDEVRKDHLDDGKCVFEPTFFVARVFDAKDSEGKMWSTIVKRLPKK